jgi:hypothetical protein
VPLVVVNVAASDGRLIQMPDERLVPERQLREAIGVQLHHRRIVDALQQIFPVGSRRRGR